MQCRASFVRRYATRIIRLLHVIALHRSSTRSVCAELGIAVSREPDSFYPIFGIPSSVYEHQEPIQQGGSRYSEGRHCKLTRPMKTTPKMSDS